MYVQIMSGNLGRTFWQLIMLFFLAVSDGNGVSSINSVLSTGHQENIRKVYNKYELISIRHKCNLIQSIRMLPGDTVSLIRHLKIQKEEKETAVEGLLRTIIIGYQGQTSLQ